MDLFTSHEPPVNLLPCDGEVYYRPGVLNPVTAKEYFGTLLQTIAWKQDELFIYGKQIITKRKVAWYGDQPFAYTYSHNTKEALPWMPALLELKQLCEATSGEQYNCCLLNLYHNGDEGMAWHSDDEDTIVKDSAIASLSLGAERKFSFKHKKEGGNISVMLATGSLLVMKGATQTHWLHSLPKTKKVFEPRINLTFRKFVQRGPL
jgi:alkylated DNA repair dioxygenase AlkB